MKSYCDKLNDAVAMNQELEQAALIQNNNVEEKNECELIEEVAMLSVEFLV